MKKKWVLWLAVVSSVLLVVCVIVGISLIRNNEPTKLELLIDKTNNEAWSLLKRDSETRQSMQTLLLLNNLSFEERWLAYEQLNNLDDKFLEVYYSNEGQLKLVVEGEIEVEDLLVEFDYELFDYVRYWCDFGYYLCFLFAVVFFVASLLSWFFFAELRKMQKITQEAIKKSEARLKEIEEEVVVKEVEKEE
jgi:uncharacterized membrane protein YciS (DUF1049 family)